MPQTTRILRETLSACGGIITTSIGAKLLDSLRSVERPGDFCVGGTREIFMPTIDVDGVGRLNCPALPPEPALSGRGGSEKWRLQ